MTKHRLMSTASHRAIWTMIGERNVLIRPAIREAVAAAVRKR